MKFTTILVLMVVVACVTVTTVFARGQSESAARQGLLGAEGYSLPIVPHGSYTLSYLGGESYHPNTSFKDNLPIWQEIERRTGITIDWQVFPGNQVATVVQTRLASGQDLPDLVDISSLSMGDAVRYGQNGILLDLTDNLERYAPNIMMMFENIPDIGRGHVAPDGGIYWLAGYLAEPTNGRSFVIRKDWLDKLGLPIPVTIDDWYKTLTAFKQNDVNETGSLDIIPFIGDLSFFGSGFGLISPAISNDYVWYEENGKVYSTATTPAYRQYLEFANRLYTEGLIDPMYGAGQSMQAELMRQNRVAAMLGFPGDADNNDNILRGLGTADADHRFVFPPQGPDGQVMMYVHALLWGPRYAMTKDVKDAGVVTAYLDYLYADPEGVRLRLCGIEGEDYYIDATGTLQFLPEAMHHPDMNIILWLRSRGAFDNFLSGHSAELNNARFTGKFAEGMRLIASDNGRHTQRWPIIIPTPAEQRSLQMLVTDIETYITESTIAFITGRKSLNEFDQFVRTLDGMGLQDLLDLYQTQFDRYLKN